MAKQDTVLEKIKVRKHLNADALFSTIRGRFEKIPDFCSAQADIRLSDALMSAFAMFSLKDSSLLAFDNRRKDTAECQNLKAIYGIETIPPDFKEVIPLCPEMIIKQDGTTVDTMPEAVREIYEEVLVGPVLKQLELERERAALVTINQLSFLQCNKLLLELGMLPDVKSCELLLNSLSSI